MTDELRDVEIRSATRCARDGCGGALVPSAGGPDVGDCCLACGRPATTPVEPLPLVRFDPSAPRPDPHLPLRDQLLVLLAEGPMRRSLIYSMISDGRPNRPRSDEIGAALQGLRDMGLVDCRAGGRRQTTWFLVEGSEGDGEQHGDGGREADDGER